MLLGAVPLLLAGGLVAGCHPAEPGGAVSFVTGQLIYTQTQSGTNSRLTVQTQDEAFVVHDGAGLTAGEGCSQVDAHRVRCSHGATPQIRLDLGDGDDTVVIALEASTPYDLSFITGGAGEDALTGGFGDDFFFDGTDALDSDTFDGGPDQTGSSDVVIYSAVTSSGVNVTLDDVANDGRAGEGDNVVGVEAITGSGRPDSLTGNDAGNVLSGDAGADVLRGLGGNDVLFGGAGFDTIDGGPDHDICYPGGGSASVVNCEMVI
jgi:Ca2+-binding RTX toxin-like protein